MLNFFSIFKFGKEEDFEAILADLDAKIQATEVHLAELKVQQGSLTSNAVIYLFGAYIAYVPTYLFVLRDKVDTWGRFLIKSSPLVLMPILLYAFRIFIQYLYTRRISSNEEILKALKTKQKLKVEELKNKSAYYQTKNLLDRYSGEPRDAAPPSQPMRNTKSVGNLKQRAGTFPRPPNSDKSSDRSRDPNSHKEFVPPPSAPLSKNRPWYDKLVDALVGDEAPSAVPQFALICQHCFAHNGLVSAIEYETVQYSCPNCKEFNPSKRSTRRRSIGPPQAQKPVSTVDMARSSTNVPQKLPGAPSIRPLPKEAPSTSAPILPPLQLKDEVSPTVPDRPSTPPPSDTEETISLPEDT